VSMVFTDKLIGCRIQSLFLQIPCVKYKHRSSCAGKLLHLPAPFTTPLTHLCSSSGVRSKLQQQRATFPFTGSCCKKKHKVVVLLRGKHAKVFQGKSLSMSTVEQVLIARHKHGTHARAHSIYNCSVHNSVRQHAHESM